MKDTAVIEIGQHYIKIAAIRSSIKKSSRKFFCLARPVSPSDNDAQLSKLISETFVSLRLKPKFLALSLPRNLVTARSLSLPSGDQEEISKMVNLHLVRILPYKKEEMVNTYSILSKDKLGYSKVLLCVVHKDILKRHLKIVADAKLFADRIYLSSYGVWEWILSNCKSQMSPDTVYFGLDIDYDYTELIVFSRENLLFTRSIAIKAEQLLEETGAMKLVREIRQSLAVFGSEYEYKKPEKIFISGATDNLNRLESMCKKELEMSLTFLPMELSIDGLKSERIEVPRFISVTSLRKFLFDNPKRISFNILETQVRKALREKTRDLIIAGSLLIYIFFIICGAFLSRIYNRQVYLKRLELHSKTIEQDIGDLIHQSKRIDFVKDVLEKRKLPLLFFQEIYRAVPSQIAIKQINIVADDNKATLRGEAARLSDVFAFINVLEESRYFKDVQTKYTRKKKTRAGVFTDFELSFSFRQIPDDSS